MEQSVLTDQDRRWVDAVVKLTTMTYEGKMKWSLGIEHDFPRYISKYYSASLAGQSFVLNVEIPTPAGESAVRVILNAMEGVKVIKTLKDLTVVRALADAVLSTTEEEKNKEEEFLKAIESA